MVNVADVVQQIINALSLGGIYAILGLGLAMVFSIFRLINFAHGDLMTITGYALLFGIAAGLPFVVAAILAVAVATLGAMLMERVAFRPLRGASVPTLLLASLAVSIILQILFQTLISSRAQPIAVPAMLGKAIHLGPVSVPVMQLVAIVVSVVLLVSLNVLLKRTTLGIAMRAAATNFPIVRLMGINANRVISAAFAASGLLAGGAAILWISMRGSVDPMMGLLPMFKAFIAVILGGLGRLSGAVVGGFVLAFIEVAFQTLLPSGVAQYQDALIFLIVVLLLAWRPHGLVGGGDGKKGLKVLRRREKDGLVSKSEVESADV